MSRHRLGRPTAVLAAMALASASFIGAAFVGAPVSNAAADPGAPIGAAAAETTSPPASDRPAGLADDRLVVALDPGTSADQADAVAESVDATDSELVGTTTLAIEVPPGDKAAATAALNADDRVQYVQPNYALRAFDTPNDPLLASQYGVGLAGVGGISAPTAWNTTLGSSKIVIGVLDSGLDLAHPDLVANLWTNRTGIKGCGYGTHGFNAITGSCNPKDDDGHGTHVGGIAAARGNNGVGGTGVDRQGSLMALKMLDSMGHGGTATAVAAIDWAVAAKTAGVDLRVLVASWGGEGNDRALSDAIAHAGAQGILFVTAAGNGDPDPASPTFGAAVNVDSTPEYPCSYPLANIICVGAASSSGALARTTADPATTDEFNSNFGAASVDLVAPGVQILSTVPPGVVSGCGSGAYCYFWGTSMATPFVAGAAALVLSAQPILTVAQVKQQLLQAVDPIPSLAGKVADRRTSRRVQGDARLRHGCAGRAHAAARRERARGWRPGDHQLGCARLERERSRRDRVPSDHAGGDHAGATLSDEHDGHRPGRQHERRGLGQGRECRRSLGGDTGGRSPSIRRLRH